MNPTPRRTSAPEPQIPRPEEDRLRPIGAVSAETGIDVATLRVWERRYGYPVPIRKPSGHRVFTEEQVTRLHLIAQALKRGYRPGQAVRASLETLKGLLEPAPGAPVAATVATDFAELDRAVEALDPVGFRQELGVRLVAFGPRRFVRELVAPYATHLGERWSRGEIGIYQEHFASQHLLTALRALLAQRPEPAEAPRVLLTTLPGEQHTLGIQMVAVLASISGCAPMVLGPETPVADIAAAAKKAGAAAVGLTVTLQNATPGTTQRLTTLRSLLPPTMALWVGGSGALRLRRLGAGVHRIRSLDEVEDLLGGLARPKK
ncbi:MAG: MerR family transcriptional regulator [Planctomycetes bacterium]|nr:MerR family transcriptional regulator [Planctomycetota bacterium]